MTLLFFSIVYQLTFFHFTQAFVIEIY